MKKLNLTEAERNGISVTFEVNKFVAYLPSGALLGKYSSKNAIKAEFRLNNITNAKYHGMAIQKYLENYGNV
jgi:hypothetical protein